MGFAPAPAWADISFELPKISLEPEHSVDGRTIWLSDSQVNIVGGLISHVSRIVSKVTSPDGLQAAGNAAFSFDPEFEELNIHHIRIIRDGETIEPRVKMDTFRRERNLERAVFDGRLTAHISISDLRVGDIVDVCHGIRGANPILAGHFCAEWMLDWSCWVGETRVRLIAEADRPFTIQDWNGVPECVCSDGSPGEVVRSWQSRMTPPVVLEPHAPGWVRQFKSVRVSDALSWSEVADAFRPHYAPERLPPDLEAIVEQIGGQVDEKAERVVQALRLVQGSLRYQSVSIGDGGFVPRRIAEIWASRMGDCKDASRLLVAVLGSLGIDAEPALVNTGRGAALNDEAPSLVSFNHCIVAVTLQGRRYWLDPTLFPQGGALDVLQQARHGWALPLKPVSELQEIDEAPLADSFQVSQTYELPERITDLGRLDVRSIYFGWRADLIRRRLAGGADAYSRELIAPFERRFGAASELTPLEVHDDLVANRLELAYSLRVGPLWKESSGPRAVFEVPDDFFRPNVPVIAADGRKSPIALGPPLRATSTVEIRSPVPIPPSEWDRGFTGPGMRAASRLLAIDGDKRVIRLNRSLTIERTTLKAGESPVLADFMNDLAPSSSVVIRLPIRSGAVAALPSKKAKWNPLRVLALILSALWMLGVLLNLVLTDGKSP